MTHYVDTVSVYAPHNNKFEYYTTIQNKIFDVLSTFQSAVVIMCTTCCNHSCYNPKTALPNEKGLRLDVRVVSLPVPACPFATRQVWWGYNRNDPPALALI
jgi:nicotinamide mononucleotide adenylyltransferase